MRIACFPGVVNIDYTVRLVGYLSSHNDKTLLFLINYSLTPLDQIRENLEYLNSDNIFLNIIKIQYPRWRLSNLLTILRAVKSIQSFKPELIHIQDPDIFSFMVLAFLRISNRKYPVALTFHDIDIHKGDKGFILYRLARLWLRSIASKIFIHGNSSGGDTDERHRYSKKEIMINPLSIDNSKPFEKYKDAGMREENAVLFFGWITAYKGLEYLIEAEPLIKKETPDVKIIIAGRTGMGRCNKKYFDRCYSLISNKDSFILYNSYIPYDLAANLFKRAKIIVLPYTGASQSGVVSIAYSFKKPVIAAISGLLPEQVENNVTGILVPPNDSRALAEAIIRLLKNEPLRKEMGLNGYRKLTEEASQEQYLDTIRDAYKEIINEKH